MAQQTTYTQARQNLARLLDDVVENREIVRVTRRSGGDVALIAADELDSILETLHLLRSPANAARLTSSLRNARRRKTKPRTVQSLRDEAGLAAKE
ncbi:MAG TPA: type II toxin-antitoxin system prevent-host-death family antitoxin [Blastocatellia bacterium]|nr:type II toxin-antitoxin system prevent-host-death family antitoxin [Blastocatellia bacterium]